MDKELLRIAIIATGLIIMVAMIVSAYLKSRQDNDDEYEEYEDEFDNDEYEDDEFDDEPVKKPSLTQALKNAYNQKVQQVQQQRQKLVPVVEDDDDDESDFELEPAPKSHKKEAPSPNEAPHQSASPSILQFSVITKGQDDFNVADVFHVLEQLGMEYGSMKVFERVDENRFVHFGVASMVEPGTFPDTDLENHYCPGVVFFMQFDDLANPREVFDDYVATAMLFAQEMDGVVLDHRRQPLTDAMVNAIRAAM
ncbi:MAG: cell division protein ZipA C-terminal FtsZ-binding domain-containing protein [Methylococcales bacterium]|nr:cell division protein ZipA C-terminal FtsZ-binding domain-containing protein [Methylococcales bacterium]